MAVGAIRIRMYRVGFGDCFLVSLPVGSDDSAEQRHILVDCGVHPGGSLGNLPQIVDNIAEVTGRKLALVVASHAHKDHIAGFGQCAEQFSRFEIGEVWLPWTDDPSDNEAVQLGRKQLAMVNQLAAHFAAVMAAGGGEVVHAAQAAIANLADNQAALQQLRSGFGVTTRIRYLKGDRQSISLTNVPGLAIRVLGPPHDPTFLAKMDPPPAQRYLRVDATGAVIANGVRPFADRWRRSVEEAAHAEEFGGLRLTDGERQKLKDEVASPSLENLAFTLDTIKNNTSLVLLFSFRGKLLLFPGDAQYGNWRWWLDNLDAADILPRVNFFKVAHHGSHNASPRDAVEQLTGHFAAMVSTQNTPWDSIPRLPLIERLTELTAGKLVRSDSLAIADKPDAPKGPAIDPLPEGFERGDFWYDYSIPL